MEEKKLYVDYFDIDPKYYAAVTADLIQSGQVKWDAFYPHETFVNLLEKTHTMLSGKDSRSLWVEGAYGTGKSHAALTVKSLLEASDEEVRHYFADYGLKEDLCEKLIADKNNGQLITIHRIGSASIRSDQDLILAIQDSITDALQEHGIQNRGESSLRDAAIWDEVKDRLKKSALGLSGGQQQRLCIARALAVEPDVLLMDEPTSALDPISTSKIEELATELKKNYTIVIVTHNMQQALRISDSTAFFLLGELVEYDNTEKLFSVPSDKRTEDYITGRFG